VDYELEGMWQESVVANSCLDGLRKNTRNLSVASLRAQTEAGTYRIRIRSANHSTTTLGALVQYSIAQYPLTPLPILSHSSLATEGHTHTHIFIYQRICHSLFTCILHEGFITSEIDAASLIKSLTYLALFQMYYAGKINGHYSPSLSLLHC
jgi:hypothetical protein